MKRVLSGIFLVLCVAGTSWAQAGSHPLRELAETAAVSGYEGPLVSLLKQRLDLLRTRAKFSPQVDNLGNVWVTLGSGAPPFDSAQGKRRMLVTCVDEAGYVVSAITEDGYLRVQRLPQRAPHPWFDLLHSAQPASIWTRSGKFVPGVVAGLSTHIQPGRQSVAEKRTDDVERLYIDIGARSPEEARALGVDLLDPLTLEKRVFELARGELAGPTLSARAGAAALIELLERIEANKIQGTLIVAFAVRHWMGSQGLDRLVQQVKPDEVILVESLPESGANPGSGVLIATSERDAAGKPLEPASGLAGELLALARSRGIPAQPAYSAAHPRNSYTGGPDFPARTAQVGVGVKFPLTPAEVVSASDVSALVELLAASVGASVRPVNAQQKRRETPVEKASAVATTAPKTEDILQTLVETCGVSGHEEPVADAVRRLLPEWARKRAETDGDGNLWVSFGKKVAQPRLLFVAHTDEIGWTVEQISDDGRLLLRRRGGYLEEHFLGHVVLVHTRAGRVPAVLELPANYWSERYALVPGREHTAYLGVRSRAEAEALGVAVGDSVTVPKKYRRLAGTRANGRSFDDRVGSTALVAALWQLDPAQLDREVTFLWAVEEEIGLRGAKAFADRAAASGNTPEAVFAVDTFVSADSPLESKRFADGVLGQGFVIRAVDSSNVAPRGLVERVIEVARQNNIRVQYGVTGGGNDGAVFVRHGAVDVPIAWPLRYSHSAAEVIDLTDVEALARIVAALARSF